MLVEQELERPVRLRAERDLRPEQEHLALAERALDAGSAAFEIVLAPAPTRSAAAPSSRTTPPASRRISDALEP